MFEITVVQTILPSVVAQVLSGMGSQKQKYSFYAFENVDKDIASVVGGIRGLVPSLAPQFAFNGPPDLGPSPQNRRLRRLLWMTTYGESV